MDEINYINTIPTDDKAEETMPNSEPTITSTGCCCEDGVCNIPGIEPEENGYIGEKEEEDVQDEEEDILPEVEDAKWEDDSSPEFEDGESEEEEDELEDDNP